VEVALVIYAAAELGIAHLETPLDVAPGVVETLDGLAVVDDAPQLVGHVGELVPDRLYERHRVVPGLAVMQPGRLVLVRVRAVLVLFVVGRFGLHPLGPATERVERSGSAVGAFSRRGQLGVLGCWRGRTARCGRLGRLLIITWIVHGPSM